MTTAAIEQANGAVTNILQNDALNLDQKLAGIRDIVSNLIYGDSLLIIPYSAAQSAQNQCI